MTTPELDAELHRFIVDRISVGILSVDSKMTILQWNRFMENYTAKRPEEVVGKNLFDCFPELPRKWFEQKIRSVFLVKNFAFISWRQRPYLWKFPHNRPVTGGVDSMRQDVTLIPAKDPNGEVTSVTITLFDVTDASLLQKEAEDAGEKLRLALSEVEKLSNLDGLTKVYNRRYLENSLLNEFKRFRRYNTQLSFILFDLDHFKKINDTRGHLAGDEVLRGVGGLVPKSIRETDVFGRYGGEEFALILPGVGIDGAVTVAERIRSEIATNVFSFDEQVIPVTISVGVTAARPDMEKYEQLISEADLALYQCKRNGRNCVTRFTPEFAAAQ